MFGLVCDVSNKQLGCLFTGSNLWTAFQIFGRKIKQIKQITDMRRYHFQHTHISERTDRGWGLGQCEGGGHILLKKKKK